MSKQSIRIAIDCMGGDVGLAVTIPAAAQFAHQYEDVRCLLVGDEAGIAQSLKLHPGPNRDWYQIVHASEVIAMDDSVEVALRRKKNSSMRVAAQSVKDGLASTLR